MVTIVGKTSGTLDNLFSSLLSDVVIAIEVVDGKLLATNKSGEVTVVGAMPANTGGGTSGPYDERTFSFPSPENSWICAHNFHKKPVKVKTVDSSGAEVIGDVTYPTEDVAIISWWYPTSGVATISP